MMLQELCDESNLIYVNNTQIENVKSYIYLGQCFSLRDKNQDKEILRRITAGWTAYVKHRNIFKSNFAICLNRKVYNSCVLPAMTYGAETWSLTKMKRSMLNITYHDRKTNTWVRAKTGVTDMIKTTRRMKWSWAGHISRLKDDKWTKHITTWRRYGRKRL